MFVPVADRSRRRSGSSWRRASRPVSDGENSSIRTASPEMCARTVTGPRFSGVTLMVMVWLPSPAAASAKTGFATWSANGWNAGAAGEAEAVGAAGATDAGVVGIADGATCARAVADGSGAAGAVADFTEPALAGVAALTDAPKAAAKPVAPASVPPGVVAGCADSARWVAGAAVADIADAAVDAGPVAAAAAAVDAGAGNAPAVVADAMDAGADAVDAPPVEADADAVADADAADAVAADVGAVDADATAVDAVGATFRPVATGASAGSESDPACTPTPARDEPAGFADGLTTADDPGAAA